MRRLMALIVMVAVGALGGLSPSRTEAAVPYEVWVTNQATDEVVVLDGHTLQVLDRIVVDDDGKPASSKPHMIVFSPDYRYAYVANVGSPQNTNNVVIIRTADRKIVASLPAGPSAHAAVPSPDGRRLWVTNIGSNDLTEILVDPDAETFTVTRRISAEGVRPICHMFTEDGKKVYVTNGGNANVYGSLVILDAETGALIRKYPDFGREACGTVRSLDGKRMFANVGFHGNNAPTKNDIVYIFDTATDEIVSETRVGKDAHGLNLTPDGRQVWVVNRQSNNVNVFNAATMAPLGTYNVGDKPDLLAFSPGGERVFITLRGEAQTGDPHALTGGEPGLAIHQVATGQREAFFPLPGDPHGLAVRPATAATPEPTPTPIPLPLPDTSIDTGAVLFPQTGFTLGGEFLGYWRAHGGLPVFGYPIDSARQSNGAVAQWLERARFEAHPGNRAPYNVLLGRLGVEALERQGVDWQTLPKAAPGTARTFRETGHAISHAPFWAYWSSHGLEFDGRRGTSLAESVALFGYPISEARVETNSSGHRVLTQWFERARFEYHPNNPPGQRVLLGRLGAEIKTERGR